MSIAKLIGVGLSLADLSNRILVVANVTKVGRKDSVISNSNLERVELTEAQHWLLQERSTGKSIARATITPDLVAILEDHHPHLPPK